jgi:hypothetical protein
VLRVKVAITLALQNYNVNRDVLGLLDTLCFKHDLILMIAQNYYSIFIYRMDILGSSCQFVQSKCIDLDS